MSNNVATLIGNITGDVELRYTPQGVAVANFSLAVNSRTKVKGGDNEYEDKLDGFFRVNVWRQMAENVAESLNKGDRVIVTGPIIVREYETDNGKGKSVEITATEIGASFLFATAEITRTSKKSRDEE